MISKQQNVFQNQEVQNAVKYSCSFCYKQFASCSQLAQHKSVHGVRCIEKCPYVCCFCCKRFKSSAELLQHLKHHNYQITFSALNVAVDRCCDIVGSSTKHLELLRCKACGKPFRTRSGLQSHVRSCHKVLRHSCRDCGSRCNSAHELRTHMRCSHSAAVCDVCGRCFAQSLDLRDHRLSHGALQACTGSKTGLESDSSSSSNKSLQCKDCGSNNFKTRRSLMVHLRTCHGSALPHRCAHCPRRFLYASDLRKHERRHTGQRPHVCTECGKGFFHVADLEVHGRAHRGDAPLTCSVCSKWMSSMTGLRLHMQIHRPNAPLNVCTICQKQFSYLSSLRTHMKRQHAGAAVNKSEWKCAKCSVEFSNQLLLDNHVTSCHSSMYIVCCFICSVCSVCLSVSVSWSALSLCANCCFTALLSFFTINAQNLKLQDCE